MHPNAVDKHTCGQWIQWIHDRSGELLPTAALREMSWLPAGQDSEKPARCDFTRLAKITSQSHLHVVASSVVKGMRDVELRGRISLELF